MRNIIVGRDGKLWLVDWGWSGFYPPFCEYIATKSAAYNDRAPMSWCNYIPLITGRWLKEVNMVAPAFPCHLGLPSRVRLHLFSLMLVNALILYLSWFEN
jgi:hypothetical protein